MCPSGYYYECNNRAFAWYTQEINMSKHTHTYLSTHSHTIQYVIFYNAHTADTLLSLKYTQLLSLSLSHSFFFVLYSCLWSGRGNVVRVVVLVLMQAQSLSLLLLVSLFFLPAWFSPYLKHCLICSFQTKLLSSIQ